MKTIFTSNYRLAALNLEDPRIREGLDISLRAMKAMHERAAGSQTRFLVLMIPTKESVFRDRWQEPPEPYRRLVESEEGVWMRVKEFFDRHGIEYLDALPVLRERTAAGIQLYPVSCDGHPNELGHDVISITLARHLGLVKRGGD